MKKIKTNKSINKLNVARGLLEMHITKLINKMKCYKEAIVNNYYDSGKYIDDEAITLKDDGRAVILQDISDTENEIHQLLEIGKHLKEMKKIGDKK